MGDQVPRSLEIHAAYMGDQVPLSLEIHASYMGDQVLYPPIKTMLFHTNIIEIASMILVVTEVEV